MILCCVSCFSDKKISQHISQIGRFIDRCSYCKTENTTAIEPIVIFEFIEKIDSSFQTSNEGISLFDLLFDKLKIFSEKNADPLGLFERIIIENNYLTEKNILLKIQVKLSKIGICF